MAGICSPNPILNIKEIHAIRCCSSRNENWSRTETKSKTPKLIKLAVSGMTEILRVFSFTNEDSFDKVKYEEKNDTSVCGVDDVVMILKADYENAYFVTGVFTSAIYAQDCVFEDPTIRFQGTKLYQRNLKLLVPFFDSPSIVLQNIEKGVNSKTNFVLARWKLRTYLKFPWRPFISIDGSTVYELSDEFKVIRHSESWNVSALEAIGQIFTPSFRRRGD